MKLNRHLVLHRLVALTACAEKSTLKQCVVVNLTSWEHHLTVDQNVL